MSDDLVKSLEWSCRDPVTHEPIDDGDYSNATVSEVKQAIAEITRLRAELATARCEGMEHVRTRLLWHQKNHYLNWRENRGVEVALGIIKKEIDAILAAAKEEQ